VAKFNTEIIEEFIEIKYCKTHTNYFIIHSNFEKFLNFRFAWNSYNSIAHETTFFLIV